MSPFVLLRLPCGLYTLLDLGDLDRVQRYYWNAHRANCSNHRLNHRVQGLVDGRTVGLHRWLMGAPVGLDIDHINGDGLDNRRSVNLRACTRSENVKNRIRRPSPLSMGWIPRGVPVVALKRQAWMKEAA